MKYSEFLLKLERIGFDRQNTSSAFRTLDDWVICIIGLSGRFQISGTKAFVICARPIDFEYMDKPKKKYVSEPMEYPFKLTIESDIRKLRYKSKLLNFDYSRIETDSDWSQVYEFLVLSLPKELKALKVSGLVKQLKKIKDRGFIEKIWLGETNA
jgi:hypothetical protein